MSDIAPQGPVDSAPAGEAPAETSIDATDVDWKAKYEAEVNDRMRERERYKPIAQAFQGLHPDDVQAISTFAQTFSSGDNEGAVKWMIDNARALAGDNFQNYITPAQQTAITEQAKIDGVAQGLTPDQVGKMVEERIQAFQKQQQTEMYERQISETLINHGWQPDSPLAAAAMVAASKRPDLDLVAAIREVEEQVLSQAQAIASQRAAAAGSMGNMPPSGSGMAAVNNPVAGMSPREKAMARLEANGL